MAAEGSNELYVRYGDIPTGYAFDASYSNPVATDQEAPISQYPGRRLLHPCPRPPGCRELPATLRADLLPLSITKITPDQGGTGDADHRWVTFDILGSHFKAGALVKLSRPGVYEAGARPLAGTGRHPHPCRLQSCQTAPWFCTT